MSSHSRRTRPGAGTLLNAAVLAHLQFCQVFLDDMTSLAYARRADQRAAPDVRWRVLALTAAALLVGFALRSWLWLDQGRAGMVMLSDSDEYYLGAIHLWLDGSYYDSGQWLRPPLTSLFFALAFVFFGPNMPAALLIQCGLSALTALLVGATARQVWQSTRAGLAATWATALYLPLAVHASLLLSETVFIFAIALAFYLFELARRQALRPAWLLLLGGAAFGAAALARPVGLYAAPLLGVWAYLERPQLRAAVRATALLGLGCALVILPWTARNYLVYRQLVLVDTNGGVSFWFGTINDPDDQRMQDVWKATLPNSALRQQAALRLGIENVQRDPLRYVSRMRNKMAALWQPDLRLFAGNAVTGVTLPQRSLSFNLLSDAQYVALMLLALLGLVVTRRSERNWALLLWPLYGTLLTALTLGHPRLRLPLLIVPLIYAALPLAHPGETWRRLNAPGRWRRVAALLTGALVLAYLLFSTAYIPFLRGQLRALGSDVIAARAAVQVDPNGFLPAYQLAQRLRAAGDLAGAEAEYRRAAELNPRSIETHAALLSLARLRGDQTAIERARAAMDAIGWDNNMTYRWAWAHEPYSAPGRLDLGRADDLGAMHGFSRTLDQRGQTVRATVTDAAQLRLDATNATALTLRVRAANQAVPLRVLVDGVELSSVNVSTEWRELSVPLPEPRMGPVLVELRAPLSVTSLEQPYPYGVLVDWAALQ